MNQPIPCRIILPDATNAVTIWRWDDAPEDYRRLSPHGGDEDWVAFVPTSMKDEWMPWLEVPAFGCCDVSEHEVVGGTVRIAAHA